MDKVLTAVAREPDDNNGVAYTSYDRFVRKIYFPFLGKAHRCILLGWLAVIAIGVIYGSGFLSLTSNETTPPEGTSAYDAWKAFQTYYPHYSSWPPLFIVERAAFNYESSHIIGNVSKRLSFELHSLLDDEDSISIISGYWDVFEVPALRPFAADKISPDNRTMSTIIAFTDSASLDEVNHITHKLLLFAEKHSYSREGISELDTAKNANAVYCTGSLALFLEMSEDTEKNFVLIDTIVLPIAIGILGYCLGSWRHMIIAFLNLICTIMLAFTIMRPITNIMNINPFAPSIMLSLGIAICFDYSLFSLKAFRGMYCFVIG
jgi:hypothetical protein